MKSVEIRGETFRLFPERAIFREQTKTLLVADLHWGKAETFQRSGIAISSSVLDDDLARLSNLIEMTDASAVWVLGDLIHSPRDVTPNVVRTVAKWRAHHPSLDLALIRGNHDRRHVFPEEWQLRDAGTQIADGPFLFVHDQPESSSDLFTFVGHKHPVLDISSSTDRVRLPCFLIEENRAWLPAFSAFTGGSPIARPRGDSRVYAIADGTLVEL